MQATTPKFLKHKPSGRVYPYHPQLMKLGDDVVPFEMPAQPAPAPTAEPTKAAVQPAPTVEAKPDRAASARAALAKAREARKNPEPELPLADEAPTGE